MVDDEAAVTVMLDARRASGLSWTELGERVGHAPVWVASALHGQQSMPRADAEALGAALDLPGEVVAKLTEFREKGHRAAFPPTDPVLYRLHEVNVVYGQAIKAVMGELFGDGIMSAIDFRLDIERKPDPAGDRVVITLDGKFLPYKVF